MTATSLAGQRALDELRQRHGQYEAALAIGFTEREAVLEVCRPTAGRALVPAPDQTRTVGLVTLPGAFVGVLLGGGSAVQALPIGPVPSRPVGAARWPRWMPGSPQRSLRQREPRLHP